MFRRFSFAAAALACGVLAASTGHAASTGTSAVTLGASANAVLQVLDPYTSALAR